MVIKSLSEQSERLQTLITAAQSGDKAALLQLCEDFKPLLQSEARREMFYRSLGKDAEGIAALTFIELVLKYNGADFENWPGLARCKVHFALFDAMQKQGRIWENEAQIDTGSEAGIDLLDTGLADTARLDELARLLLSLELQEALRQLSAEQQQILTLLFLDDLKPKEVAGRLGCSVRNITKHRLKALDRLRQLLTN
ncbi:RNA polymerase sigma factor [uncultured Phascolarctobacterium sp.]|jgi:RNA polymerase sigma factor (sigma-70 family)|uniref:RNA polymerase sigma factor n=1 Tax=uncultured Phascolarctobacterium sp. TaxID=512296 RepID=UPI0025DC22A8|nr:sigma-70 family RNA polymerase sigma factor [uncultured Phascolarctobacterium sp.]